MSHDARTADGSLYLADGVHVRIALRCLVDDLRLPPRTAFEAVLAGPVGRTLGSSAEPSPPVAEAPPLSRPTAVLGEGEARLVLHPSRDDRVLWVLAAGRSDEECVALAAQGRLWPAEEDRRWLAEDRLPMQLRRLQVEAPIAVAEVRTNSDLPIALHAVPPAESLRVGVSPSTGATIVGVLLAPDADPAPRGALRTIALMLSCVHADADWTLMDSPGDLHDAYAILGLDAEDDAHAHLIFSHGAQAARA